MVDFQIVVIGAGAAGLVAAARAAQAGRRVLLLEKNRKTGAKILMSGGTRCNLTHDCGSEAIIEAFGKPGRFLRQALRELSPQDTVSMFNGLGVATKVEDTGKVFPRNDRAVEVRDALLQDAIRHGVQIQTAAPVVAIERAATHFEVVTGQDRLPGGRNRLTAERVIVTSGGRSWPGCGTTGDGYRWLQELGHTIEPTRPALVPLTGGATWSQQLSGLTLPSVSLSVWNNPEVGQAGKKQKPLVTRSGGFLFTHQGFSGPAVMDVSRQLTIPQGCQLRRLQADFLPDMSVPELESWLAQQRQHSGGQNAATVISRLVPKRLATALVALAAESETVAATPLAELRRGVMQRLVTVSKTVDLTVRGSRGFEKAEVTAGGVRLKEVDPRTMESRLVPGLHIAGEVLDLDGWIGGYNFQSAFSTGHVAGQAAAALVEG
ncbi:BaiN/RdsA family NAD(P)/FAD-dependent oxidoreductase [Roseimaritima ulvae]|uniref:Tricarballylate dehydrogenase n=1 Tax=Roseimaritima ulvae TaxID=980254 RepID=A0A5B9QX76_9BACT|nr:aminoacetone oxidase family FAD-binding enzyme [Roseimaritima ulvae]QEG43664.1 tricarballylate dehydrogenase [Roseimaritima ulvae]